jgi:hypothetical protein
MFGHLTEEGYSASGNRKWFMWDEIVERQFSKFGSPAILHRGQAVQTGLHTLAPHCVWCSAGVLRIDSLFQPLQFAFQSTNLRVMTLKQTGLKPTVEVLNAAVALWTTWRNQERFDAEAQAQAQNTGEVLRSGTPANNFAGGALAPSNCTCSGSPKLFQHSPSKSKMTSIFRER